MDIVFLVNKVLSGQGNHEERERLKKWRAERPGNEEEFESLKLLWEYSLDNNEAEKSDPTFYDGLTKIKEMIEAKKLEKKKIRRRKFLLAIILAILFTAVLIVIVIQKYSDSHKTRLQFKDAPLGQVIETLENKYNVSIEVDQNEILGCHFTGLFFGKNATHEILKSIAAGTNLEYQILGPAKFKLTGVGCK